jgi:hypothetical protein
MSRKTESPKSQSAITFKVDVSRLPEKGITARLDASPEERAALAAGHGVEEVRNFRAEFNLSRWKLNGVRVRGFVDADIVQLCVVTLEPLNARIREEIDVVFLPEGADHDRNMPGGDHELQIDFEGEDAPETFLGNKIDLGAIAEEFYELGIDPYPKKPGAEIAEKNDDGAQEDSPPSPFAALGALKLGEKQEKN